MVFRKENKVDAFQRQISALRQQLGTGDEGETAEGYEGDDRERSVAERDDQYAADATPQDGAGYGAREAMGYSYGGYGSSSAVTPAEGDSDADYGSSEMAIPTPQVDAQTSVIAHDTVWKGDLQSEGTVHVHGRVEGAIRARQDVYIAEEADVDATVTATNVVVAGLVKGTVRCSGRFEVLPPGRIAGDVQAPTLVVHEGATVTGQFRMGSGEGAEEAPTDGAPVRRPPTVVQRRAARGGD